MFNTIFIKEIIKNYFNKHNINNYDNYDKSFYIMLSYILNNIKDSSYYSYKCYTFLNNSYYIDFDNLLNKYSILLEYQPFILLLYEILAQFNLIDYTITNIDDAFLLKELTINNNFTFLYEFINEIINNNLINSINLESLNIK